METVVNDTEKREEQKTVIVRDFDGTTESLKKLNQIIKDNQKMVIIGELADAKTDIGEYISTVKRLSDTQKAKYIPGERDYKVYFELYDIIGACIRRSTMSEISRLYFISEINKIISRLQFQRPDVVSVFQNIIDNGANGRQLLSVIKHIKWIGEQPIYTIEQDSKMRNISISHAECKIVNDEVKKEHAMSLKEVVEEEIKRINAPSIGFQRKSAEQKVKSCINNYLLERDDRNSLGRKNLEFPEI